jgi:hypothetical protein
MIQTDQGKIPIQHLNPTKHTIKHANILAITQSINTDEYCVLFKPHAFQKNVPSHPTIITMNHKILNETTGKMEKAKYFLNKNNDKICQIQYDGSILYNVLMKRHQIIEANNMKCETLHPNNIIARIYTSLEKERLIPVMNQCILKGDQDGYKRILERIKK